MGRDLGVREKIGHLGGTSRTSVWLECRERGRAGLGPLSLR